IAHLNSIKDLNNWCPYCRGFNKTITDMYELAQQRNGKYLSEKYNSKPSEIRKPDFLKTNKYPKGLELDIYYPQYGFAIEIQGIQHKYQTDFFHKSLEQFQNQLIHDQNKKELCNKNNIALLEI
ncbi:13205_t:CDS:2, partial [Racocetra persica]